jgi:hypothetical protein
MAIPLGRRSRHIIACAAAVAGLVQPAAAQTAIPVPAATPAGFTATAHADATIVTQTRTITGSVQLGMAERPGLIRIDLLSVKTDAMPVPPIRLTAVIDRRANTITVWNDLNKKYYVQAFLSQAAPSASPRPTPTPSASVPRQMLSPFANLDVLSMTIKLTGHTFTNGVPTTGLSFDLQLEKKGETVPLHVMANAQIVDASTGFPMTLDLSVERDGTPNKANLTYAVDELIRAVPPLERFKPPAGYTKATSIWAVVVRGH